MNRRAFPEEATCVALAIPSRGPFSRPDLGREPWPARTHTANEFSGISISGGKVFVTTFDSNVYGFGVKEQ